jgi:hypothetical protein
MHVRPAMASHVIPHDPDPRRPRAATPEPQPLHAARPHPARSQPSVSRPADGIGSSAGDWFYAVRLSYPGCRLESAACCHQTPSRQGLLCQGPAQKRERASPGPHTKESQPTDDVHISPRRIEIAIAGGACDSATRLPNTADHRTPVNRRHVVNAGRVDDKEPRVRRRTTQQSTVMECLPQDGFSLTTGRRNTATVPMPATRPTRTAATPQPQPPV